MEQQMDLEDDDVDLHQFLEKRCGCKQDCLSLFPIEVIIEQRLAIQELTREEKDLVLIGQIRAHRCRPGIKYPDRYKETILRSTQEYFFAGLKICRGMFLFLHVIGHTQLSTLCSHVDQNQDSIKARTHGSKSRLPHNTTDFRDIQSVKDFILHIGRVKGQPLPGRMPGLRETEGQYYLESDQTHLGVYNQYVKAAKEAQSKSVKYSTFCKFWRELVPNVKILSPATDLCDTCADHSNALRFMGHLPEEEKMKRLVKATSHLNTAKAEREYYNDQIESSRNEEDVSHISFDYAQQIHYPYNNQQRGSAFFKTPRKCGIFGICEEAPEDKQVNYLIDESDMVGKGANVVVSMVHHYLLNHWVPTPVLVFHADNCVGQNKNNTMMQYLMWHLLTSETEEIEISFMISGHTKFAPDRHFGLIKKKYARSVVDTMDDISRMVKDSSPEHNQAQFIKSQTTDEVHVKWYAWSDFLKKSFKHIPYITKYHHFRMSKENPGIVRCSVTPEGKENAFNIMTKLTVNSTARPKVIHPEGLSQARQKYLHEQISTLCSTRLAASISCPDPATMTVIFGDSCIRDLVIPGVRVESIGGLRACDRKGPEQEFSLAFLAVGGNDLSAGRTPQQVASDIGHIALELTKKDRRVVICTICPRGDVHLKHIMETNKLLRQLGWPFLRTFKAFKIKGLVRLTTFTKQDRLHPNGRGVNALSSVISGYLRHQNQQPRAARKLQGRSKSGGSEEVLHVQRPGSSDGPSGHQIFQDQQGTQQGAQQETQQKNLQPGPPQDKGKKGIGQDTPQPGSGQDTPQPGSGQDTPQPGSGQDTPQPGSGQDMPQPGSGQDTPQPSSGQDTPQPGSGQYTPQPGSGQDTPQPENGKSLRHNSKQRLNRPLHRRFQRGKHFGQGQRSTSNEHPKHGRKSDKWRQPQHGRQTWINRPKRAQYHRYQQNQRLQLDRRSPGSLQRLLDSQHIQNHGAVHEPFINLGSSRNARISNVTFNLNF